MGVCNRGARQRPAEAANRPGRQSPDVAEGVHRDAGGLGPRPDGPIVPEGDEAGFHAPGARLRGEVHHESLQPTDLQAVDDVCHLHRIRSPEGWPGGAERQALDAPPKTLKVRIPGRGMPLCSMFERASVGAD